jgi:hypothetical protein
MTSQIFKRLLQAIMVTTPFMAMMFMVLALWGIGGKATYSDINPNPMTMQPVKFNPGETNNYLIKGGDQSDKTPAEELEKPKIVVDEVKAPTPEKESPEKIKWELVV